MVSVSSETLKTLTLWQHFTKIGKEVELKVRKQQFAYHMQLSADTPRPRWPLSLLYYLNALLLKSFRFCTRVDLVCLIKVIFL